jgi:succinate dehydrogenase / fumarate reductase flavoprotein subunit
MYQKITAEDPYQGPMRIYPAVHYTMGGLWVDYHLQSTLPGLFVVGEANFSDHGANRLGASALMQGLADGYFVLPNTIADYLASQKPVSLEQKTVANSLQNAETKTQENIKKLVSIKGKRSPSSFHKELGLLMWKYCGMARNKEGLLQALQKIPELREEFWNNLNIPGSISCFNQQLEKAGRVADFLEFSELMCQDALAREESCGGHFREEHQTEDGEANRDDKDFCHVAVWEHQKNKKPTRHKEELTFANVKLTRRSYK